MNYQCKFRIPVSNHFEDATIQSVTVHVEGRGTFIIDTDASLDNRIKIDVDERAIAYKALIGFANKLPTGCTNQVKMLRYASTHFGPVQTADEIALEMRDALYNAETTVEAMVIAADYVKRYEAVTK